MFHKTTWDERLGLWSNRGFITVAVIAGIWVATSLLGTVWKASWIGFFNGLSAWAFAPVLIVTLILWLASVVLAGGNRGQSWSRRLFSLGVKCGIAAVALFVANALFTKCAQLATSGGFFQGLFVTLMNFTAKLIVPAIIVTVVVLIVAYVAKRDDVSKWLNSAFSEDEESDNTDDDEDIWGV